MKFIDDGIHFQILLSPAFDFFAWGPVKKDNLKNGVGQHLTYDGIFLYVWRYAWHGAPDHLELIGGRLWHVRDCVLISLGKYQVAAL